MVGLLGAAFGVASAQTFGEITGVVQDPSGAAVPNASVKVTNTETSAVRESTTNTSGLYSFPDLPPGVYSVRLTAAGFENMVKSNIVLQVQQTARVDFAVTVGQANQTIEVSANAALLTTENAT